MDPDHFKQAWQSQAARTHLTIDAEVLVKEVRRNQEYFTAMIFWRDVREVGGCLLLLPVWLYLGARHSIPWTWYLAVPALLWIAGFMLVDRMRHGRQPLEPDEPLSQHAQSSLAQVKHQIWLLRNIHWWYLLPLAIAALSFFGQVAWQERSGGWWTALGVSLVLAVGAIVLGGLYWLNQYAVRYALDPRRRELEKLLMNLKDELPELG